MHPPEFGLAKHISECALRAIKRAIEATEEPLQPRRDIELTLLRCLQHVIIRTALVADLRGHAVKALRALVRSCERHISDRARSASVAVLERVDGDEPEMGDGSFEHGIRAFGLFELIEKLFHL